MSELSAARPTMPFSTPLRVSDGILVPLEQLSLSSELDAGLGTNRALSARSQIAAQNDVDAIRAWLARFVDTRTTFDTYRKESERLLLWSTTELRKLVPNAMVNCHSRVLGQHRRWCSQPLGCRLQRVLKDVRQRRFGSSLFIRGAGTAISVHPAGRVLLL